MLFSKNKLFAYMLESDGSYPHIVCTVVNFGSQNSPYITLILLPTSQCMSRCEFNTLKIKKMKPVITNIILFQRIECGEMATCIMLWICKAGWLPFYCERKSIDSRIGALFAGCFVLSPGACSLGMGGIITVSDGLPLIFLTLMLLIFLICNTNILFW